LSIKDKIINEIKTNEKINRYKELEKILNDNSNLKQEIEDLKSIQKQLINARHFGKKTLEEQINNEYNLKISKFESYPLLAEYIELQEEINNLLQSMKEIVENDINSDLIFDKAIKK